MKLGLGTVNFGMGYGLAGAGRIDEGRAVEILDRAAELGVAYLDTAPGYGECERVLGRALRPGHRFRIVTKIPRLDSPPDAGAALRLRESCSASLDRLGSAKVYGLLAHHADDLLADGGERLVEEMLKLREEGRCDKIGASVYHASQVEALSARFPIDLIQLPISLLDQRLDRGGQLAMLKRRGIEIHARSVFLQGLLLMDPETLPSYFDPIRPHLVSYNERLQEDGLSRVEAAVGYVRRVCEIDAVICGVDSLEQLDELATSFSNAPAPLGIVRFGLEDPRFVDPTHWNLS